MSTITLQNLHVVYCKRGVRTGLQSHKAAGAEVQTCEDNIRAPVMGSESAEGPNRLISSEAMLPDDLATYRSKDRLRTASPLEESALLDAITLKS